MGKIQRASRAPIGWAMTAALLMLMFSTSSATAALGDTTLINVNSDEQQGNSFSERASVSADGRFVAFDSYATNLVPDDTNDLEDVFVRDRVTGTTERVSVASDGTEGNFNSTYPAISADGRYVAFHSESSNLVAGDNNWRMDVFVHDRLTGTTTRVSDDGAGLPLYFSSYDPSISADGQVVAFWSSPRGLTGRVYVKDLQTGHLEEMSVNSAGTPADRESYSPTISANGRYVAFVSFSSNLVPGDTNDKPDVFVHDRQTGETTRVSVTPSGGSLNAPVYYYDQISISADGRYVAYATRASNVVPNDTNIASDVFVHDRLTGETERVSVDGVGRQTNKRANSSDPALSADGRIVAFWSDARNLVEFDTNGRPDVFVHDRQTGATHRVSVASDGSQANGVSAPGINPDGRPTLNADGTLVVFRSLSTNLVAGDTNGQADIFAHELAYSPVPTITCDRIADATIIGTAGDDILTGTAGADVIVGLEGDDTIHGLGGDDLICGDGIVNDVPVDPGDDTLYGDDGNDHLDGSEGFDTLFGGADDDLLRGNGSADELYGEAGDDDLRGGWGPDLLDGGPGVDTLDGSYQEDTCLNGETLLSCP